MKQLYLKALNHLYEQASKTHFDGCHCHRIVPGYAGGEYVTENVLYMTQTQHSKAHWLRWKIYGDIRDKRSYKMIGIGPRGLSREDRVALGKSCAERSIGAHALDYDTKRSIGHKTMEVQKQQYVAEGTKNFYYWSTPAGRSERSKLGGLKSWKNNKAFVEQQCLFNDKEKARLYGARAGKKSVTNGKINRKLKTEEERQQFLADNPDWRIGLTRKKK